MPTSSENTAARIFYLKPSTPIPPLTPDSAFSYERILYFLLQHIHTTTLTTITTPEHLFGTYKHWAEGQNYPHEDSVCFNLFRDQADLVLTALPFERRAEPGSPATVTAFATQPIRDTLAVQQLANNILTTFKSEYFPKCAPFHTRAANVTSALTAPTHTGLPPTGFPGVTPVYSPPRRAGDTHTPSPTPDYSTKTDPDSLWFTICAPQQHKHHYGPTMD